MTQSITQEITGGWGEKLQFQVWNNISQKCKNEQKWENGRSQRQCLHGACIPYKVSLLMLSCWFCSPASFTTEKCVQTKKKTGHLFFWVWFIVAANEMWNNWKMQLKGQFCRKKNAPSFLYSFLLLPPLFISISIMKIKLSPTSLVAALKSTTKVKFM